MRNGSVKDKDFTRLVTSIKALILARAECNLTIYDLSSAWFDIKMKNHHRNVRVVFFWVARSVMVFHGPKTIDESFDIANPEFPNNMIEYIFD